MRKRRSSDGDEAPQSSDRDLLLEGGTDNAGIDLLLDVDEEDEPPPPAPDDPGDEVVELAGTAARDDALDEEGIEIAKHLAYRAAAFGDAYPFELVEPGVLELREFDDRRWLYVALLIAANLRHLREKKDENKLTTYFELLAPSALRGVLGDTAEIHLFGTSTSAAPGRYEGSLYEKASTLSTDLRLRLLIDADDPIVNQGNPGDHGLDVVAFFPFADAASTMPIIFAQCACGVSPWPKMEEPTEGKWHNILKFNSPVINMLIIPQCFRQPDGTWFAETSIHRGVLIDRVRLFQAITTAADDLPVAAAAWPEILAHVVGSDANDEP